MERSPLHPIPSRPPGPVAQPDALAIVRAELPALEPAAAEVLARVVLGGVARTDLDLEPAEASALLAVARKQLRAASSPLPGGGWCERAERLVSDRFDGVLDTHGERLLSTHLGRCPRCVEHERRLAQAESALAGRAVVADTLATAPLAEPPSLRLVEPTEASEAEAPPEPGPASEPVAIEHAAPPAPEAVTIEHAAPSEPVAGRSVSAVVWNALTGLTVLLTVLATAIAIAGAFGAG